VNKSTLSLALLLCSSVYSSATLSAETNPQVSDSTSSDIHNSEVAGEVVITGTRTERLLEEAPVRTEVISRETLDQIHARDLTEALKIIPGLMLKDIHGKGGQEVWLQGLDADRVLILVNGRPISASTGSSVDVSQLGTVDIERIEIVKGATSALYGSSAMGGVVNVITRKPTEPFSATVIADIGSYGDDNLGNSDISLGNRQLDLAARHARVNLGMVRGQWTAQLNGSVRDKDGYDLDLDTPIRDGDWGTRTNLSARVGYETLDGDEYFVEPSYYKEDLTAGNLIYKPGSGYQDKTEEASRTHIDSGARLNFGDDLLALYLTYETFEDVTKKGDIRSAEQEIYKASAQWDTPLNENQLLTMGIDLSSAELSQHKLEPIASGYQKKIEIGDGTQTESVELYIQNDIFWGNWEFLPGLRYQNDSDFGDHLTPKLNLQYRPDWFADTEVRFRAGIGRGYRVPNLKERYYVFDHSNLGYMVMGNPDLTPEYSNSYQLGAELTLSEDLRFDLNLFHNQLDDLITTGVDEQASTSTVVVHRYINIDKATITGVELSSNWSPQPMVELDAAITWMDTENEATGRPLPQRPEYQIKTGLTLKPTADLQASLHGIYQSKEYSNVSNNRFTPAWTTWDLKLNYQLNNSLKVFMGIDNLADVTKDPGNPDDQGPHPGRFVYTGLRLDI